MKKNEIKKLSVEKYCQVTNPEQLDFETTEEIKILTEFIGQPRALEAIQFGTNIKKDGFNLYAMGPTGIGKRSMVRAVLENEASKKESPKDWCYVHNFENPQKPHALALPNGFGFKFRQDMEILIEDLNTSIPMMFESEDFRSRLQNIHDEVTKQQEKFLKDLNDDAKKEKLVILPSQQGFAVLPTDEQGEVMSSDAFAKLPDNIRESKEEKISEFSRRLSELLKKIPLLYKKRRKKEKELENEFALIAVEQLIDTLKKKYEKFPDVIKHLDAVRKDILLNVKDFVKQEETQPKLFPGLEKQTFARYQVNLLVNNENQKGAPIIYEDHPTYANLICRVEHIAQFGTLLTDFTLIRAGSLHKANGGYLVIDARKILSQPFAWDALKRALYSHSVKIESPERMLGLLGTTNLDPEPIPLDIKIILIGNRSIYYLLLEMDPDFNQLFKVAADFEEQIVYNKQNIEMYARLIATLVQKEKLKPFDKTGVAAVIDHSLRLSSDTERLSTHMRSITDLLREADFIANTKNKEFVEKPDVKDAINAQIRRLDRYKQLILEEIDRDIVLIETEGERVGQINGLSVIDVGGFLFGHPSKITARVHVGKGEVIDIQREVKLSGPIHAKGVLVLTGFLAGRYIKRAPFSITATLVFEQTYGMIDGDSASVAELCVLLSAIGNVPLRQHFAVTGSINQHGIVQAIGGINEKIEGFFDICQNRGLTGNQGVLIPSTNVKNLMLREDVIQAAKQKKFHIYPIDTVDQAVYLMTGLPAGVRNAQDKFPKGTINYLVEACLQDFAKQKRFMRKRKPSGL